MPFIGLGDPQGVAVDSTGDVYVVDFVGGGNGNGEVLELPANGSGGFGSQQALPFSGLLDPEGIAVDSAGDVYIGGFFGNDVLELSADIPSGSLIFSPGSGPDNTGISVSSVTPCPPDFFELRWLRFDERCPYYVFAHWSPCDHRLREAR